MILARFSPGAGVVEVAWSGCFWRRDWPVDGVHLGSLQGP